MFATIAEGFVARAPVACGPRCVVNAAGEILCVFMVQSKLGINDFVPLMTRSTDGGLTWTEPAPVFAPEITAAWSIFCSVGPGLFLHGIRTAIGEPGESFWSDETQGMKQNEVFWSRSPDDGKSWTAPTPIPMDGPGSAEAPCPLTVTRSGRWIAAYSPYNTFDASEQVIRERVVIAYSDDQGRTWSHRDALRFSEPQSGGAEAWIAELSDGRLLAASWHVDHTGKHDFPNAFALSEDAGSTWTSTASTGTLGQSISLTPLPGERMLLVYNQRKHGEPGVWLAVAHPTPEDFGIDHNAIAWHARRTTQHGTSAGHSEWTDFSFGEPSITLLPD
ncbi:MAG: sialidase family protein, partial [Bryobacteraceae bacterium]